MKATINGNPFEFHVTGRHGLTLSLLSYMSNYSDNHRGQHVLLELDAKDLDEIEEVFCDPRFIQIFQDIAKEVNEKWQQVAAKMSLVDESFVPTLPLPNPYEIKLEIVLEAKMVNKQLTVCKPVFQILSRLWVGVPVFHGAGYIDTGTFYIELPEEK